MSHRLLSIESRVASMLALAVMLTSAAFSADSKPRPRSDLHVVRSDADEFVFEIIPKAYREGAIQVAGHPMTTLSALLSGSTSETGRPELPEEGYLLAIPPGKEPAIEVVESKFVVQEGKEIAPAPTLTPSTSGEAVATYNLDGEFYATHAQFYPSTLAEVGNVIQLREYRVARVVVHPVQYNPVSKQLRQAVHLQVRVRFKPSSGLSAQSWIPATGSDPGFEPVYNDLIANYSDAAAWRGRPADGKSVMAADSTGAWFQTGRTYYRIPVAVDGLYRFTYAKLLSYGLNLAQINTSGLAVYCSGQSVPIVVQVQDSLPQNWYIEFYAQRRYGTNSFYNRYSDTSYYWLTWNDAFPRRIVDVTGPPPATPDTSTWYLETLHQEKDLNYFFGVTQDDIENTYDVPGEGWFWQAFVSGQSAKFPFTLDTVKRSTGVPVLLRARFYGMTICQGSACKAPSRQSALLNVNRRFIGEMDWNDNSEAIFTGSLSDSVLRAGLDTFQVSSKNWAPSDSNITEFYLDWFEVQYPRPLKLLNGVLKVTIPQPAKLDTSAYIVTGAPRESVTVYDLTTGRRILNLSPHGSQAFVFSDTNSIQKTYFIAKNSSKLAPISMTAKTFANLRSNSRGADYIVVTHPLFLQEANTLAQYRATANRLRPYVVSVQDIYDEFNYGLLDPEAIRSFLKASYYNWKRPSPSTVVMFGDASWDFKRLLSTSVKVNYVPSFGNPPSDNALVCFDPVTNFIPYMLIGRIPVENTTEADQVVSKIINFESTPVGDWSKSYLFITSGDNPSEKATFNYWSDDLVNRYVTTYPFGGAVSKVYKSSDAIIDGDEKQLLQSLINNGIVFVNYIGHSGGRIWGVDIGSPYDFLNTTGQLPFVSSVSCNVGFFSDPTQNVLAEDFLMANNRGAIAVWAASSIGYGSVGRALVDKFLSAATVNYARNLGLLTTISRLYFWIVNGVTTSLVIQTEHLHPLIGDPYSQFAAPLQPDLDVSANDIVQKTQPATSDSTVTLNITVRNRGLMVGNPILVSVQDSYTNERGVFRGITDAVPPFYLPDFVWQDSFSVTINVRGAPGSHTITVQIDPKDSIAELRKDNNTAQKIVYVYRNRITQVKPPPSSVFVNPLPTLAVTLPAGNDTTPLSYTFVIDTVASLSSLARVQSPAVVPGKVSASWQGPSLLSNHTYYWSAQSTGASTQGVPVTSSFYVSFPGPGLDTVVWRQRRRDQFTTSNISLLTVTDTGATMQRSDSTKLLARSLGYRADVNKDYYGLLEVNSVVATGMWWDDANSFLLARFDPSNGYYRLKGYDLLTEGEVDSMTDFLKTTPVGSYIMISAVENAQQNVTDSLYSLIQQLGSVSIRSVQPGQSWLIIARKGDGHAIIEDFKPTGIALDSIVVPNTFSLGSGRMVSPPIGPASKWAKVAWDASVPSLNASARLSVLGLNVSGRVDTLVTVPNTIATVDISHYSVQTYPRLQLLVRLANNDGSTTATVRQWSATYLPTADLAVSAWTFKGVPSSIPVGAILSLSLDVYNIGYERADSAHVSFYQSDDTTNRVDVVIDSLAAGSQRHLTAQLKVTMPGTHFIVAQVEPNGGKSDLITDNNTVAFPVTAAGIHPRMFRILFDGVELHDGDYASARPLVTIAPSGIDSSQHADIQSLALFVDKRPLLASNGAATASASSSGIGRALTPESALADGDHELDVFEPVVGRQPQFVSSTKFRVTSAPQLLHVYNYPNPFSRQTAFTFVATGLRIPDEVRIRVYTVAGRLIKNILVDPAHLQLGYNSVAWDGRDQDGDEVGNGVYLYKVSMISGGKEATAVEKLAKVR